MRSATLFVRLTLILAALASSARVAAADLGPLEPLADLHRAVHEALGLPEPVVVRLLEQGMPDAELPAIGLLAARSAELPERILAWRRQGMSFLDITLKLGLTPEVFYVPFPSDPGPPYGRAWGYYRKTPRASWRTIRLSDDEIVRFANVKLCADFYQVPPLRVVELDRRGVPFPRIHTELRQSPVGAGSGAKVKHKAAKHPAQKPGRPRGADDQGSNHDRP
ncbi:MAG: hypothetical protein U0X73_08175 [Thermoanaerobaculia bacterium]